MKKANIQRIYFFINDNMHFCFDFSFCFLGDFLLSYLWDNQFQMLRFFNIVNLIY